LTESERPQSPFAGQLDFSAQPPVRTLSPDEIERILIRVIFEAARLGDADLSGVCLTRAALGAGSALTLLIRAWVHPIEALARPHRQVRDPSLACRGLS
jgi:hypothetical protein